jgi:hypothetical protein
MGKENGVIYTMGHYSAIKRDEVSGCVAQVVEQTA